jgi:hypothetical protein
MRIRLFVTAGTVLATAGLGLVAPSAANAAKPTITAGSGSDVTCAIGGKAKLDPPLKNDWVQADHQSDPNGNATVVAAMASIPDTTYSVFGPVTTSAKIKSISCTGTVTDGTNIANITSAKMTALSTNGDGVTPATCAGLVPDPLAPPQTFDTHIDWKADTALVTSTDITSTLDSLIDAHGVGFELTSTGITGSFAGGTSVADAYVGADAFNAISGTPSDSVTPSASICEAQVNLKLTPAEPGASDAVKIKLKKPKGLKTIVVGPGLFDSTDSNIHMVG